MHIVHTVLHFPTTKLEYQEVALAREQLKQGHKVTIITSDWHNNFPSYDSVYKPIIGDRYVGTGVFIEEGINIIRLKLIDKIKIFVHLKRLKKTLKSIKPDLIICHGFESGLLPLQSKLKDVPMVIDSHYVTVNKRGIKYHRFLKKYLKNIVLYFLNILKGKYLFNKGVIFFGVTEESVENIHKKGKIPKSEIDLLPLATNRSFFFPSANSRKLQRKEFNIKEKDVLLCYTGKVEEYKGILLILKAMKKLDDTNLYCLIVGSGSSTFKQKINAFLIQNSLEKKIFFKPFSDKKTLNMYFNACDIAVYPKSVTISHIEAMAVGLPIIIEDIPCIKHRVENKNGFTVKEDDINSLTNYLKMLINDHSLRKKMGLSSLELVEKKFNWEKINQTIFAKAF